MGWRAVDRSVIIGRSEMAFIRPILTITRVREITDYQVNGTPTTGDRTSPTITVGPTPSILWPPNGKMVTVTVSGAIQDNAGGSGIDPGSLAFFVVDEIGRAHV